MRITNFNRAFLSLVFLSVSSVYSVVAPSSAWGKEPTYWQDVRAALRKHCTVCHNTRSLKEIEVSGGLALDSYDAVMKRKGKPLVKVGKSGESLLIQMVTTSDTEKRMPLGAKALPAETIALLRKWVDSGAAEGKRVEGPDVPVVVTPGRRRKLDITLSTALVPAKGAFAGAPAPLKLVLRVGPLAPVVAVVFSPDGKLLASGAYGRVTVWDLRTGRPIKVLTSVLGAVNDLRFSPDGALLAVAGGQPSAKGDLRLFQTSDWKLKAVLPGHDDVVASVAFRHDGKKLASASFDKSVRVWDVTSGKLERTFTMHSDFVHAVAFSPDGKYLYSASKDRSVRAIDATTGAGRFTFSDRYQDVLAVAVSPDGKSVVASGLEPGLSWWNAETGARVRLAAGHRLGVHELAFSKDGKLLVSAGGDGTLRLWNGGTGALVRVVPVGSLVYATALSPDGKIVAAGSFDGLVRLYDTGTGKERVTLLSLPPSAKNAEWLALTPQGYAAGSDELLAAGRWRMGAIDLPPASVWRALRNADAVARALRGEATPAPVFRK
jgi:DNA-binding beta-propeller fold protein YncE